MRSMKSIFHDCVCCFCHILVNMASVISIRDVHLKKKHKRQVNSIKSNKFFKNLENGLGCFDDALSSRCDLC